MSTSPRLLTRDEQAEEQKRREAEGRDRPQPRHESDAEKALRLNAEATERFLASEAHAREVAKEAAFLEATCPKERVIDGCRFVWSPMDTDSIALGMGISFSRSSDGVRVIAAEPEPVRDLLRKRYPTLGLDAPPSTKLWAQPLIGVGTILASRPAKWRERLTHFDNSMHARLVVCSEWKDLIEALVPVAQKLNAEREKAEGRDQETARKEARQSSRRAKEPQLRGEPHEWLRAWANGDRVLSLTQDRLEAQGYLRRVNERLELTQRGEELLAEAT